MLRETLRNARCKDKDFWNQFIRYCTLRRRCIKELVTQLIRKREAERKINIGPEGGLVFTTIYCSRHDGPVNFYKFAL